MKFALPAVCAALMLAAVTPAQAAAPAAKTFWLKRCSPQNGKQYCEVYQQLSMQAKGQKAPVRLLEMAIGYPAKTGPARLGLVTPLNVALQTPVRVQIGDNQATGFNIPLSVCESAGCLGFMDLTPAVLDEMRAGQKMTVTMPVYQGKNVAIVMPMAGFGPALAAVKP